MTTNQRNLLKQIKSSLGFIWEQYNESEPLDFDGHSSSKRWWQVWRSTEAEWIKINKGKLALIAYKCRRNGHGIVEKSKKLPQNSKVKKLLSLAKELFYISSVTKSDDPLSYSPVKNEEDMKEVVERLNKIRKKVKINIPLMEAIVKKLESELK